MPVNNLISTLSLSLSNNIFIIPMSKFCPNLLTLNKSLNGKFVFISYVSKDVMFTYHFGGSRS